MVEQSTERQELLARLIREAHEHYGQVFRRLAQDGDVRVPTDDER